MPDPITKVDLLVAIDTSAREQTVNRGEGPTRRDFLAGAAAGPLLAGCPWLAKAAVAATGAQRAPDGAEIARVRIYPAIGICRVGGSRQWFLAPEVPGLAPQPEGGFKDGDSRVKKQVQRFRLYAFDADDRVIGELTTGTAKVERLAWSVRLANTKAAWYGFNNPLDNGELAPGLPGQMRNQYFVDDAERERMLVIDGGSKTIAGTSVNEGGGDPVYRFVGRFWDELDVCLGELRTDAAGACWSCRRTASRIHRPVPASPPSPTMTAGTTTGATGR